MVYATLEQARAAGAVGDDAAVLGALATARTLIDRYTASVWEPTPATIVARVGGDATALLPWPVRTITSVTPVGSAAPLAASGYLVLSSSITVDATAPIIRARTTGLAAADQLLAPLVRTAVLVS